MTVAERTALRGLVLPRPKIALPTAPARAGVGVASLVEAFQLARKKGGSFALVCVSTAVMRVLSLARLDRVFTIHPTVEAAVAAQS